LPIEIIVKLRIESTRSDLEKTAQKPVAIAINLVSPPTISVRKKSILTRIFCLRFPVGRQIDQMMKKFGPNRFIGSVELNRKIDYLAYRVEEVERGRSEIVIVVVDSGIDLICQNLQNQIWAN